MDRGEGWRWGLKGRAVGLLECSSWEASVFCVGRWGGIICGVFGGDLWALGALPRARSPAVVGSVPCVSLRPVEMTFRRDGSLWA
jgi:hypothetical protein